MSLLDEEGRVAAVGKSIGYWLDEADFVFSGEDHEADVATEIGLHTFPRDWPDVYNESEVMRSLLKKKGPCAAKRVSVVPNPGEEHRGLVDGLELRHLQSLANAETVKRRTGLSVVEGWALYDLLDDVTGAAFAAERYWWNSTADGTWLDFSPRPENLQQLLLVEALSARPPKKACALTKKQHALAEHLLKLRFPKAAASAARAAKKAAAGASSGGSATAAPLVSADEVRAAVKRVKLGIADPIYQLVNRTEADVDFCEGLVQAGMCGALVGQLFSKKHAPTVVQVLAAITRAAVEGGLHKRAAESFLAADGVEPLVELLCPRGAEAAADASSSLGHLSYRSPEVQERAARAGAVRSLVHLLGSGHERCAGEAAYALWHLQVGSRKNCEIALSEGATAALVPLLAGGAKDQTLVNVAGALMPLATAPGAQDELGEAGAVPALCALLTGGRSPQVREHAAGALMNLLRDHEANCEQASADGMAVKPLQEIIKEGTGVAQEYAAGALANLLSRANAEVASDAIEAGTFETLTGLLPVASTVTEIFAAMGNLAKYIPEDRAAIYEAGTIERMVAAMLDDDDDIARYAAVALCMNLAPHIPSKPRLVKAGAVKPLAGFLEHPSEELRERAAGALANLMDRHTETVAKVFLEVPDLAKKLVYALETEYSRSIQQQMARALALLSARQWEAVRKAGAVEPLAEVMEEEVAWEAALGLMNLAPVGAERHDLLRRGAVPALVRLLEDPRARSYAAGALANLTAGCAEAAAAAIGEGAVPLVLSLLREADGDGAAYEGARGRPGGPQQQQQQQQQQRQQPCEEVVEWAVGALGNLAEYGTDAARRGIVEGGGLESMVRLLKHGQGLGPELAVFALGALADNRHQSSVRQQVAGCVEELRGVMNKLYEGRLRDRALSLLRLAK